VKTKDEDKGKTRMILLRASARFATVLDEKFVENGGGGDPRERKGELR